MRTVNVLLTSMLLAAPALGETRMVMVEQAGCIYCARWDREIAPIWPKSDAGRRAPLRRVDLHDLPDDIAFESKPRLTPTFVLTVDGDEKGRIEGYSGDEFFWTLAERMLDDAGIPSPSGGRGG